ncbi:HAD family hydrolase [Marinobacter zhanjiangensis]|uniref:phosphoglycolate phosphatase n=1 Tax=Marinobacter zhanjiangensis TaxID=578215 RepID=A0ABQ3B5F3_9GAMM|nr:HAD family hydrolase [Marinobacter zhanjiangensis]GGY79062.1 haloacid dehalogenase [Marinobacter zhanjiangensis]
MVDLASYRTWVFDCDGVLLNSNKVKTDAFFRAAEPYGRDKAYALVDYHIRHGGISRYVKFHLFLSDIVGHEKIDEGELGELLDHYASHVRQGLLDCDVASGLTRLRELTSSAGWLVVSGGDQAELRSVFGERGLADLFDGGIYGSPDTKDEILTRTLNEGILRRPGVFVGDSQYDIEAATRAGLDFIFLRRWSESGFDFADATVKLEGIDSIVARLQQ